VLAQYDCSAKYSTPVIADILITIAMLMIRKARPSIIDKLLRVSPMLSS
jgi:hypothetical protein